MLRALSIRNIILVESVEVSFASGFTVISGETGAGKSAIMAALSLVAGARSDSGVLRKGADKGIVEATFDQSDTERTTHLLEEAGISWEKGERLLIRRELSSTGRSRAFINDQLVSLSCLKAIGDVLIEMVGQHASQELRQTDHHRLVVDLFGSLSSSREAFALAWQSLHSLTAERDQLNHQEAQRIRDMDSLLMQQEELDEANIQEGEEEELFAEYSILSNAAELMQGTETLAQAVSGDEESALRLLTKQRALMQRLVKLDAGLRESEEALERAILEMQELGCSLGQHLARLENNPQRLTQVSERLSLINKLKRKYGPLASNVCLYHARLRDKIKQLEGADARLGSLQKEVIAQEQLVDQLAQVLSQKRTQAASKLERALFQQLASLNMPKVQLQIRVQPQKRTSTGDDLVEMQFAPNTGERLLAVQDCASGGELSRLLLAIKAVLADKQAVPTLVFDEIDANIGGETALIVGRKLAEIGQSLQLLCITHFPQVARFAQTHLLISKEEEHGRTFTRIEVLNEVTRAKELQRMIGGGSSVALSIAAV